MNVVCKLFLIFALSQKDCGRRSRKRLAFICTEKSGKLQSTTDDCEHVPSLVGIISVQLSKAHILYILQGCGLFHYLCTGFTRAFGRIARGSHFFVF